MVERLADASPRVLARIGGALYLIIIAFGIFGELFVRGRIIVWDDPVTTAENILASESLWRFSVAAELFYLLCAVVLAAIFYVLLRPVSKDLALVMVFFNLVAITIEATGRLHLITALTVLQDGGRLTGFDPGQVRALAYVSLRSHGRGFSISLLFFGCVCLLLGYLILRSGYLPKLLGLLMQIAGVGYLMDGFALILSPAVHGMIFPFSLMPAFVAETAFALWLLVKGVNEEKWRLRADDLWKVR